MVKTRPKGPDGRCGKHHTTELTFLKRFRDKRHTFVGRVAAPDPVG
jgi:hypothetical protein